MTHIEGVAELERILHDAKLELGSLRQCKSQLQLSGTIEGPTSRSYLWRLGRYRFRLLINEVDSFIVEDEEQIGELLISSISYTMDELVIESSIPGRLRVRTTDDPVFEIEVDAQPYSTRRWYQWRRTGAGSD